MNVQAYNSSVEHTNFDRQSKRRFSHFVFCEERNQKLLLIAFLGVVTQLVIFKFFYPYPDFISDSYSYIATNSYNMDVNLWPIGYSRFLLFVHQISHSDTFLVATQYLILEASLTYFYFSVIYLHRPTKRTSLFLFIFILFNPAFIYISNCILSDALFTALTIIFITQFLWMYYHPTNTQVLIQGIAIGLAFTVRYTAIYYPLIALFGMLLSRHRPITKMWGSILGLALIVPFVIYTKQKTKEITGTPEFSVFGGWQIANNALYMYNHINVDSNKLPPETRTLDRFSKQFFRQAPPTEDELAALPGTYFIKVPWAILKPYMAYRYPYSDPPGQFKAWGKVSPIYNKYGRYLIFNHPTAFARYFLWLNTKNYFLPHLEKFETYNVEINTVPPEVQDWFDYTTPDIYAVSITFQGKLFYIYPTIFMFLNISYGAFTIWLVLTNRFIKLNRLLKTTLLLITALLIINFGFSVLATPVVLRYQIFPMILLFTFTLLLWEQLDKIYASKKID